VTSEGELCFLSAIELARRMRTGEVSAREVAAAHVDRIAAVNPAVNAIVTIVAAHAAEGARLADDAFARGESLGPLHGLPIAHKDLVATAGIRTTSGSPIYARTVPDSDDLLVERARAYRAMCDRAKRPARPRTFEEMLNYGVLLHNRGDFAQAVKYLQQALALHPRHESALYCLAAAQARAGDPQAALKALRSAIHANPATRAQARRDDDFEPLRGASEFQALVAPTLS